MRRRDFIKVIGAAALLPPAARAQQTQVPVVGYIGNATPDAWTGRLQAFRQGLKDAGFIEGQNVIIEYRWSGGQYDRLRELADDLVRQRVNVIVTPGSTMSASAAIAATKTIPIVFETGADPVANGLVPSLNRPGGNVTGISSLNNSLASKRLEVLHQAVPSTKVIAVLFNPAMGDDGKRQEQELQTSAKQLGLELLVFKAGSDSELEALFPTMRAQAGGLLILSDAYFISRQRKLAELSLQNGLPTIFQNRDFAAAGGLMSYGGDPAETHTLAGLYVARILKGEKPGDLAVIQGSKVELTLNLKTAKVLGVEMPQSLLGRANEVIE